MARFWVLPIIVLAAAAVLAQPASAANRGKGHIQAAGKANGALTGHKAGKGGRRALLIIDDILGGAGGFHGLPPGLGKRHGNLPHGLAKRGVGNLPPGLAKGHGVPPGLANRSQLPPGLSK